MNIYSPFSGSDVTQGSKDRAALMSQLQVNNNAQVQAERERIQYMRNEEARRRQMEEVQGPEVLPGGAPAPLTIGGMPTQMDAPSFTTPVAATEQRRLDAMRGNSRAAAAEAGRKRLARQDASLTQPQRDRISLSAFPAALLDVKQLPAAVGLNVFGPMVSGAQNFAGRVVNAVTGEETLPTDARSPQYSVTPFFDTFVRQPEQAEKDAQDAAAAAVTPATRRTVEPATSEGAEAASNFEALAQAVKMVESGGDPNAVSPKGAVGTMQTMPKTLRDPGFGVRPAQDNTPAEQERVGRDYLRAMLDKYPDRVDHALAAYNYGPTATDKWIAAGADLAKLPKETREYIPKVLQRLEAAQQTTVPPSAPVGIPTEEQALSERPVSTSTPAPTAPAAPTQQFSAEQVTRVAEATQQELRMTEMRLAELNRQLSYAPDLVTANSLRTQANELRFGAYNAQLRNAAMQASTGNQDAVAQMATAAGVQYAQTPQGYVAAQLDPATGQYMATTQPMPLEQFVNALYSEASGAAQRAREAQQAALAKTQGDIALENVKGRNLVFKTQAEAQSKLQEMLLQNRLDRDVIKGESFNPLTGQMFVRTNSGVFEFRPGKEVNGMMTESELVPISGLAQ